MGALSADILFDAAVRILLLERSLTISFSGNTLSIKFPIARRLAEFLNIPYYTVLQYMASLEQEGLVTRVERVGIITTAKGSGKMLNLMAVKYPLETKTILGEKIFTELLKKTGLP